MDAKPEPPPQTWGEMVSVSPRTSSQLPIPLPGCPRAQHPSLSPEAGRMLTVEAVGGGDQAQQEDQDAGSQRDPDQGAAGT